MSIDDYLDRQVPVLRRMFEKRLRGCRATGYAVRWEELAGASPAGERTTIYDSDALSSAD